MRRTCLQRPHKIMQVIRRMAAIPNYLISTVKIRIHRGFRTNKWTPKSHKFRKYWHNSLPINQISKSKIKKRRMAKSLSKIKQNQTQSSKIRLWIRASKSGTMRMAKNANSLQMMRYVLGMEHNSRSITTKINSYPLQPKRMHSSLHHLL